jgi:hypothetical protein
MKEVQSFLGKINFLRRFISNFVELVKYITTMLRMGNEVKWNVESRDSFNQIKRALTESPVLINPDYSKEFQIFSFASSDTLDVVLLQRHAEGLEKPISFFSRELRDVETRYDIMEKKAYDLVKSLKAFKFYILHSKIIAYVPSASIKEILIQPNMDGKRSRWIAKTIEFDLEIKPTKLVKGLGLSKLLDESNCKALGVNFMNVDSENQQTEIVGEDCHVSPNLAESTWYKDIIHFL